MKYLLMLQGIITFPYSYMLRSYFKYLCVIGMRFSCSIPAVNNLYSFSSNISHRCNVRGPVIIEVSTTEYKPMPARTSQHSSFSLESPTEPQASTRACQPCFPSSLQTPLWKPQLARGCLVLQLKQLLSPPSLTQAKPSFSLATAIAMPVPANTPALEPLPLSSSVRN